MKRVDIENEAAWAEKYREELLSAAKKNLKPEPAAPGIREFETGAVRSSDADNVRYDLISPIALDEIAKTYHEGASKYGDHNWLKGMPVSDLLNHALRHVYLFLSGDRSEPHLPHAAWGLMAAIHSHKQWPELNTNLLGPGCTPPGKDEPACPPPPTNLGAITIEAGEPASSLGGNAPSPNTGPVFYGGDLICGACVGAHGGCPDPEICVKYVNSVPRQDPPAKRHHIPNVEDALNSRGPFPVIYLSGPMSGHRDLNFPAFNLAAEKLRRLGFPVLNPADFGQCAGMDWEDNLHRDLYILGCADVLVQLPGWESSRGASLEFNTAVALGKGVTGVHTLISDS